MEAEGCNGCFTAMTRSTSDVYSTPPSRLSVPSRLRNLPNSPSDTILTCPANCSAPSNYILRSPPRELTCFPVTTPDTPVVTIQYGVDKCAPCHTLGPRGRQQEAPTSSIRTPRPVPTMARQRRGLRTDCPADNTHQHQRPHNSRRTHQRLRVHLEVPQIARVYLYGHMHVQVSRPTPDILHAHVLPERAGEHLAQLCVLRPHQRPRALCVEVNLDAVLLHLARDKRTFPSRPQIEWWWGPARPSRCGTLPQQPPRASRARRAMPRSRC